MYGIDRYSCIVCIFESMFSTIRTHSGCLRLLKFLNSFSLWCCYNQLSLCTQKCSVISFCHIRNRIRYEYSLSNSVLSRTSLIRNLGVLWDDKLSLNEHLESVVASVTKTQRLILTRDSPEIFMIHLASGHSIVF